MESTTNPEAKKPPPMPKYGVQQLPTPAVQIERGPNENLGGVTMDKQLIGVFGKFSDAVRFSAGPPAVNYLKSLVFTMKEKVDATNEEAVRAHAMKLATFAIEAERFLAQYDERIEKASVGSRIIQSAGPLVVK